MEVKDKLFDETDKSGTSRGIPNESNSIVNNGEVKKIKLDLYCEDTGPKLYDINSDIVTAPVIPKILPELFEGFPINGRPKCKEEELDELQRKKIMEFVGSNLSDLEFDRIEKYCSTEHLITGHELTMESKFPSQKMVEIDYDPSCIPAAEHLATVKKHKLRMEKDEKNLYGLKLKYRCLRLLPWDEEIKTPDVPETYLEPGKDLIYHIRLYRSFPYVTEDKSRSRPSIFSCSILILGRQTLEELRDRIVCANDVVMRVDVSEDPEKIHDTTAKDLFPSGFLFINNVFYTDTRSGCVDYSAPIREWARNKKIGEFEVKDMKTRLDELVVKLGHPDVYYHQGNCEHLFTISEIRLLHTSDPLTLSSYPCHSAITKNQLVYCTTCAEYAAKWLVVDCPNVPFDPSFFCDICFKQYLYVDDKKISNFKAYQFKGNELNMLKPHV